MTKYEGNHEETDFNMQIKISADIKNYGTPQHAVFVYSEPGRIPPSRVGWYIHCEGEAWKARDEPLIWRRIVVGVDGRGIRMSHKILPGNYSTAPGSVLTEYEETFIFTELPPVGEYTVYGLLAPKRDGDEAKQYYLTHPEERRKVGEVVVTEEKPPPPVPKRGLALLLLAGLLLAVGRGKR